MTDVWLTELCWAIAVSHCISPLSHVHSLTHGWVNVMAEYFLEMLIDLNTTRLALARTSNVPQIRQKNWVARGCFIFMHGSRGFASTI